MYGDLQGGATGRNYGGNNVAYGEGRWGWLIGETKDRILEGRPFYAYYLTHLFEALHNHLRTLADGVQRVAVGTSIDYDDSLAEHALYT